MKHHNVSLRELQKKHQAIMENSKAILLNGVVLEGKLIPEDHRNDSLSTLKSVLEDVIQLKDESAEITFKIIQNKLLQSMEITLFSK